MTNPTVLSSSTITGDDVRNPAGEDLGSIKDLMIDLATGTVRFAVVSFGGFLGMGNKLFAVPFEALLLDTDKKCFVLNVDKAKLENAPGFEPDNWPNFADPTFADSVSSYYAKPTSSTPPSETAR